MPKTSAFYLEWSVMALAHEVRFEMALCSDSLYNDRPLPNLGKLRLIRLLFS